MRTEDLKCPLQKKSHFPYLVCSVHVVVDSTIQLSYSNMSLLKKWLYLDLVCSVAVCGGMECISISICFWSIQIGQMLTQIM